MSSTKTTWGRRSCSETNSTRRSKTVLVYRGVLADVAVLQRVALPHGGPETTTIPKGATARLGDRVFVAGFPTRSLQAAAPTVVLTAGIVSAKPFLQGLKFSNEEPRPMTWLQTDTPFNPATAGARWSTSGAKSSAS